MISHLLSYVIDPAEGSNPFRFIQHSRDVCQIILFLQLVAGFGINRTAKEDSNENRCRSPVGSSYFRGDPLSLNQLDNDSKQSEYTARELSVRVPVNGQWCCFGFVSVQGDKVGSYLPLVVVYLRKFER